MKKGIKPFLLGVTLLSALTACGGGTNNSGSGAVSDGPVQIDFWHTFGQKNLEALQQSVKKFEALVKKNEGVDVTINLAYQGAYDDIENKITKSFSTGTTPTMAIAYPDHVAGYLRSEGNKPGRFVYNLENFIGDPKIGLAKQPYLGDKKGRDDFVEAFIDEGTKFTREGMYTFPYMKSSEVMFYNVEATLNAMKFYKPEINTESALEDFMSTISWDDFFKLCSAARLHKDEVLSTMKCPAYYDSDSNLFISKLFQNEIGYSSIDSKGDGVIDFESGENRVKAEAVVTALAALHEAGDLTTKGTEGTYGSDSFKKAESLFSIGSSGGTGYNNPDGSAFTVGVCPVPASNNNPLYVSQGPDITLLKNPGLSDAENDRRAEYAWRFVKYLTNADVNVFQCTYGSEGYVPVRYSAYETAAFLEFMDETDGEGRKTIYARSADVLINDINGKYLTTATFPGSSKLRDQVGGIIAKVFLKQATVTQAFDDAINNTKTDM